MSVDENSYPWLFGSVEINSENKDTELNIKEHFITFMHVISSSSLNFSEVLLQKLSEY